MPTARGKRRRDAPRRRAPQDRLARIPCALQPTPSQRHAPQDRLVRIPCALQPHAIPTARSAGSPRPHPLRVATPRHPNGTLRRIASSAASIRGRSRQPPPLRPAQPASLCGKRAQKNHPALSPKPGGMVRSTGLEPVRSPTRPSNVRVCLFRHDRANIYIIPIGQVLVKPLSKKFAPKAGAPVAANPPAQSFLPRCPPLRKNAPGRICADPAGQVASLIDLPIHTACPGRPDRRRRWPPCRTCAASP